MKFLSWFSVIALALAASAQDAQERVPPTELVIETTYKPDDCTVTAKTGDAIKVHYVSSVRDELGISNLCSADRDSVLEWQQVRLQVSEMLRIELY